MSLKAFTRKHRFPARVLVPSLMAGGSHYLTREENPDLRSRFRLGGTLGERGVFVPSVSLRREVSVLRCLKTRRRWLTPHHTLPATRVNEHPTCEGGDAEGCERDGHRAGAPRAAATPSWQEGAVSPGLRTAKRRPGRLPKPHGRQRNNFAVAHFLLSFPTCCITPCLSA